MRKTKLVTTNKKDRRKYIARYNRPIVNHGSRGFSKHFEFKDVRDMDTNNKVSEYILFDDLETINNLDIKEGDVISFEARPIDSQNANYTQYGWNNPSIKTYHRLLYPTKIQKLICPVKRFDDTTDEQHDKIKIIPNNKIKINLYDYPI